MSGPPKPDIFLERTSYRQRRLRDAARLLPIIGMILWAIPLLWPHSEGAESANATATIYLFGVWVLLILLAAIISHLLRPDDETTFDSKDDAA